MACEKEKMINQLFDELSDGSTQEELGAHKLLVEELIKWMEIDDLKRFVHHIRTILFLDKIENKE